MVLCPPGSTPSKYQRRNRLLRKPSNRPCTPRNPGSMVQACLLGVKLLVRLVYRDQRLRTDRPPRARTAACRHQYDPVTHPLHLHLHLTISNGYPAVQPRARTWRNRSKTAHPLVAPTPSTPIPLAHRNPHPTRAASAAQPQQQAQAAHQ